MYLLNFLLLSVLLMIADGFTLKGSSDPLVVPLGGSVVLPCSVDSLLPLKDLEVEWRRSDTQTLIHLYQDEDIRPEAQHQDYHDRAHFFTEDIKHGNFSLLLNNLTAEDEGQYTCKVHSGHESGETEVEIKHVERLIVSGSSQSISASAGEDVTLSCSVDSHIKPEEIKKVSWKKTNKDEDILLLLYENNKNLSGSSDERYRDRVEFFTDAIHRGNFSLRLKGVRTEDKGVYICQVFAGRLSANTTVVLERLGFSAQHIMVLILCVIACLSALLFCPLIYSTSENTTKPVKTLGYFHVFLPNIMMFVAFILWGVTEGFLYETIFCCAICLLKPLIVIYVAPYLEDIPGATVITEFATLSVIYFSVLFSRAWETVVHSAVFDKAVVIIMFGLVLLLCVISLISWCDKDVGAVVAFSFFFLPSLQFSLFFFAFGAVGGAGFFVSVFLPMLFFLTFSCLDDIEKGKKTCVNLLNITSWMIFMFIFNAVMVYFCVASLKNEKDAAGWICTTVFVQVLWMITMYIGAVGVLDVPLKKCFYVFGSVGVVLFNAVALMTELILKTINGDRAVGDLRIVVYSSESLFTLTLLIFIMFEPWFENCLKCQQNADTRQQNQDPQNAADVQELESFCAPASDPNT
nr:uncharacterized protein LOC129436705 [Misgurnus anguillicaudatus]